MKLRKRFLAAVLTLAMLLTCIPFGAVLAEEEIAETVSAVSLKDIDGNTAVGKAVTELVKLGIINGYEDGTFRADNTITRGEVAKIIVTFLGQENVAFDTVPSGFPDVDEENHWAKKYIKLAADQKIVNGYEDGTFRPNDPVKYTEIVKMLVCALGYGQVAAYKTSEGDLWYAGYMAVAAEEGMLKSASVNNVEDYASRGIVAILTNNSLAVDIAQTDSSGNIVVEPGSNALEVFHEKAKISGVVTGVQQTGINTASTGLSVREITVDIKGEEKTLEVPVKFETMPILGRRISGYLQDGDNGENQKITQIAIEKTKSTIINSDMISEINGGSISYYSSEDSDYPERIGINGVKVIYNGKYDDSFKPDDFYDIQSGEIEFICNDGDGNAEVAFVNSYQNYVVSSLDRSQTEPKVYGKYNTDPLVIPLGSKTTFFSLEKKDSSDTAETVVKNLKEWDVISVMKSKEGAPGKAIWKGIVTSKKVSGKITESQKNKMIIIGNKKYEYAKSYIAYEGTKPNLQGGDYVTVYLDHEGKIAAASASQTGTTVNIAFLLNGKPAASMSSSAKISFYGITGSTKYREMTLAENVQVDGKSGLSQNEALDALKASAMIANKDKDKKDIDTTDYSQIIRYSTNGNGEVDMIDTIVENETVGEDDLTRHTVYPLYPVTEESESEEEKLLLYKSGRFYEDSSLKFILDSKTKVLEIPSEDLLDYDSYRIRSYSTAFTSDKKYRVEAYNVDAAYTADYVISFVGGEFGAATINENSPMMIAAEFSSAQGTDGIVDKVKGYTFSTAEDITVVSEKEDLLIKNLAFGDLFRYASSDDDNVIAVEKIMEFSTTEKPNKPSIYFLDPRNEHPEHKGMDITTPIALEEGEDAADAGEKAMEQRLFKIDEGKRGDTSTIGAFMFGTALSRLDGKLVITPTILEDETGIQQTNQEIFTISDAMIYVYDYTATRDNLKILKNSSADAIATYDKAKDGASQVLVYYSGSLKAKAVIIFKY